MENSSIARTKKSKDSLICLPDNYLDKFFSELTPPKKSLAKKNKKVDSFFSQLSSISAVPSEILKLPEFKPYNSAHLLIQEKGKILTDHFYSLGASASRKEFLSSQVFNKIFSFIRKSKNKTFGQSQLKDINLNFLGTFLAHTYNLKKHNLILIISRNDFLNSTAEELASYDNFCQRLDPCLDELVEKEFNLNEIAMAQVILEDLPFPVTVLDENNKILLKSSDDQLKHIQKISTLKNKSKLIIYDADQNETTSSELFHFERITLLGELLNTLRHELNNPLFGLRLTTDLLVGESQDQEQKQTLEEVKKNIIRCQSIIENFTNLYQNSNALKNCEIKKLIDEAITLAKSEIRQVKVNVMMDNLESHAQIYTNPISLVQIFFNLIVNSAQALRQIPGIRPTININIRKASNSLIIDLVDNGPGIPEDIKSKLFDPFFTTKKSGTGLGLSITAGLVQQLKGSIVNKLSAHGAHFCISLPILLEEKSEQP